MLKNRKYMSIRFSANYWPKFEVAAVTLIKILFLQMREKLKSKGGKFSSTHLPSHICSFIFQYFLSTVLSDTLIER